MQASADTQQVIMRLGRLLRQSLPPRVVPYLIATRSIMRTARAAYGQFPRHCPICDHRGYFLGAGTPLRVDCVCPACGSGDRQRLLKLWFDANRHELAGKRLLHFAPEPSVVPFIRPIAADYVSADLQAGRADRVLNVEAIDLPDASVDVVLCSHVLEHVDDRRALAEMFRVLTPGGLALLMFPLVDGWDATYENDLARSPKDRLLHFGQKDHVRFYGNNVRERIRGAGFSLDEFTAEEPLVRIHALRRGEKIFLGRKAS
jgi:SAM-dependent methyltransferase